MVTAGFVTYEILGANTATVDKRFRAPEFATCIWGARAIPMCVRFEGQFLPQPLIWSVNYDAGFVVIGSGAIRDLGITAPASLVSTAL
jgi:hypothetical protein